MCNTDLVIEKIKHLGNKIDINTQHTRRELDSMNERLRLINASLLAIDDKINTQNGRITKMEITQKNCPAAALEESFAEYKTDLKPVYILATNLKMIIFLIVGAALAFNLFNVGLEWLISLIRL